MALRNVPYAGDTAPQMVFLDQTLADVSALGIVPCTASGTNVITLTPNANTPTISAYANYLQFSFVAVATTTGAVTLKVGSLAALKVFLADGTTQASNGTIQLNFLYVVTFNSALDSGTGAFVIVNGMINQTASTIASGGTVAIGAAATDYITISGTSSIGSFDTVIAGTRRILTFSSGATLLNSAAIILPGSANIPASPGDTSIFVSEGSGNWRCIEYQKANGLSIVSTTSSIALASDVNLNNTANFFDGPSVPQGTVGVWYASGHVTVTDPTAAVFVAKLWDGTTVIASTEIDYLAGGQHGTMHLSGTIVAPAGNIRISVKDGTNTTGKILFNVTGLVKDSVVSVIRLS